MSKTYLTDKALKKNYALKGAWLIAALAIIFVVVVIRFAIAGYGFGFNDGLPGSAEAYTVAKAFVKPTVKYRDISFPESGYQCATRPDSVYIIKSYVEAKGQPKEKSVIIFEIAMKYNGGKASNKHNWALISIIEN